ncbi:MAG: hypothetical protein AB7U20_04945 [Planctomycetaceae bacterium]
MRHFIAYHNTEKMGRSLAEGNPFRVLTNKPVDRLYQNLVWFIVGEGAKRHFSLGSVFRVTETGDADQDRFKKFASGAGHVFEPPVNIKEMEWFPILMRATGHFGFGVHEIKDESVICGLKMLAERAGYNFDQ